MSVAVEMTNRAAFLRAILDAPRDDTPRMVYADWLEENGDPERAELIRLQCGLIGNYDRARTDRAAELLWKNLSKHLGRTGLRFIATKPGVYYNVFRLDVKDCDEPIDVEVNRGFVESISGPLAALLEHGPAIVRENPVESVSVTDEHPVHAGSDDPNCYALSRSVPAWLAGKCEYILWRTPENALAALSAAVLSRLRELAASKSDAL